MYDAFAHFYDNLQSDVDYDRIADNMRRLLLSAGVKSNGGLVLDLGCGTGTITRRLRDMGFDMIGVDNSPAMLSHAAGFDNHNIQYICQDMTALDLFGTIDACVSTLDCLNHLWGWDDLRKTFVRVSLFMKYGGVFLFDVNTVKKHRDVLGDNTFVIKKDDLFCVWQNHTAPSWKSGQVVTDIHLDFFEKQADDSYRRYWDAFSERAYPLDFIVSLLRDCEFFVEGYYDWQTGDELDPSNIEDQEKVVILARKIPRVF